MRFAGFHHIVAATLLFAAGCTAFAADTPKPFFFTNQIAIANGQIVLSAIHSGVSQSQTNIQALIGSPVVFIGSAAPPGGNANLMVSSNVVLEVEIRPARDVRPHSVFWDAEVFGTLKSVDFEKRVIHIQARPEDWRARDLY
jgi:hypothetical protein